MKRHIPGLHLRANDSEQRLEGPFLVSVEWASYRWHGQKPFWLIRFVVLEPKPFSGRSFTGRLYCTEKALWKLSWFLRDFGYDSELLGRDELDEKALIGLSGVVEISSTTLHGRTYLNLDAFAPSGSWDERIDVAPSETRKPEVA